jgi:hypothetical protein
MLPIEDFRNGFRANLTEVRAQHALASMELPPEGGGLNSIERAGVVSALYEAFPDLDAWKTDPYAGWLVDAVELQHSGPDGTAEANGYYAARFAVSGLAPDLAELVRRAKHRDGSAASVAASSAALSLLIEAAAGDEEIAARIKAAGLDLNNVRFGSHPAPGSPAASPAAASSPDAPAPPAAPAPAAPAPAAPAPAAPAPAAPAPAAPAPAAPPRRRFNLQTAVVSHGPASPAVPSAGLRHLQPAAPVTAVPASAPAGPGREVTYGAGASPNLDAGDITLGGARLSITAAANLAVSLTAATRALLLPAEGCVWVDDKTDPAKKSELVVLDPFLAEGLPPSVWDGALLAELAQSVENGTYQVKVYDRNGGSTYITGSWLDMNDAKAAAAERVRPELQRLAGQ